MVAISNVVTISVTETPTLVTYDNINATLIITSEAGFLSSFKRYAIYKDLAAVANDFGTHSKAYQYAASYFATSPNPVNADGYLIMGFWRAVDESVAATAGTLTSAELSEAVVIETLQSISDGSFDITIDGTALEITGLDFRTSTSLSDVASLLNTDATLTPAATVTLNNSNQLIITSKTTGATSTMTVATSADSGTFVGDTLKLATGTGAVLVQGAAADTLSAETKLAAITELRSQIYFAGAMFIDKPVDGDVPGLATWGQANDVIQYDVFSGSSYFTVSTSNPVWNVKLASQKNYRCLGSVNNNRLLAASYMARNHTVNFAGQNTAITMNLKELSVPAESYTETQVANAKKVGLGLYTTIKNTSIVLDSGANDYVDNVYNILALKNEIQIDAFNLLKGTTTKVPQTTAGVSQLVTTIESTIQRFVRSGVVAPGTWNSSDTFGDVNTFKRAISQKGYYVLAGLLSEQPESERAARKSPVIQAAIKFAGAIEHVDILVNIEY